jgi:hypothetical protein
MLRKADNCGYALVSVNIQVALALRQVKPFVCNIWAAKVTYLLTDSKVHIFLNNVFINRVD